MFSANVISVQDVDLSVLEEITLFGNQADTRGLASSTHFIGLDGFEKSAYSNIQHIAREMLSVSIQVEDNFRRALS